MTKRQVPTISACLALLASASFVPSQASAQPSAPRSPLVPPLVFDKAIVIPDVPTSPYAEPLAVDPATGRVFATPQAAKAIAVIDVRNGRLLRMIPGFSKLHGVIFDQASKRLFASDGNTGEVKVFNTADYSLIKVIPLAAGADSMVYDPASRLIYVANGGTDAKMDHSLVSAVDPARMVKVADIRISSPDLESITVDPKKEMLYASLVNDSAVAVVDIKKGQQVSTWKIPGEGHSPFAVVADSQRSRLYVTSRENFLTRERPVGILFVFDTNNGRIVASSKIGGWSDGIWLDQKRDRIYVSSGVGYINSVRIDPNDRYIHLPDVETPIVSKCSVYSAELDRFFVDVPKMAETQAQVIEFDPRP